MKVEEIFDKIDDIKEKFRDFFQQRKKVTALENHALVRFFSRAETEVLSTIKFCMKGSFLQDEDADWMNRKLDRLQINYLDWAHRTKWLKSEINRKRAPIKPIPIQTFFDFKMHPNPQNLRLDIINPGWGSKKRARI